MHSSTVFSGLIDGRHDLFDGRLLGCLAQEDDFAGVIPLAHDPGRLAFFVLNHKGADLLLAHEFEGIEDLGLGRNGPDVGGLVLQKILHGFHCLAPS